MFSRKIILFFFCLCLTAAASAQPAFQFYLVHSGAQQQIRGNYEELKEDNLSINGVNCLYQTRDGLVWIGTEQAGLLTYYGAAFKHYRYSPDNSASLPSDNVQQLWEEAPGILWISTTNGLAKLNRVSGKITRISTEGRAIVRAPDGRLYTFADGLYSIDTLQRKIARIQGQEIYLDNGNRFGNETLTSISSLCFAKGGTLWCAGSSKSLSGLFHFDKATHHWIFHAPPVHYSAPGIKSANPAFIYAQTVYADAAGQIWMGGWNIGLLCFSPQDNSWKQYCFEDDRKPSVANVIYSINAYQDSLLLLSSGNQTYVFSPSTHTAANFGHWPNAGSIPIKIDAQLMVDNAGSIWFGGDGVYKRNRLNNRFEPVAHLPTKGSFVSAFLTVNNNRSLAASYNWDQHVCYVQELENGKVLKTLKVPTTATVQQLVQALEDDVYLCTSEELFRLNLKTFVLKRLALTADSRSTKRKLVLDFYHTVFWNDSILYSCRRTTNEAGLIKINTQNGTVTFLKKTSGNPSTTAPQSNGISKIRMDSYHRIWCSSGAGFDIFYPAENRFEHYTHIEGDTTSLPNSHSPLLLETKAQKFYVGSQSGLAIADATPGKRFHFKKLLPVAVDWLVEDRKSNIWMGTADGLTRYNPETNSYTSFTKEDGYRWERYQKPFIKQDGNFLMRDGDVIDPYALPVNDQKPTPRLVDFIVAGQSLLTDTAIDYKKHIRLQHDQNFFSIAFACNNLINAAANRYRYRLQGIDKDWVEAGTRTIAYYTALPPGDYNFSVQAGNNDGLWGEKTGLLVVSIIPAWYQTAWAKLLLAATILCIALVIYKQRINAVRAKSTAAEREAELRQVKAEFDKQIAETEMAALRAQMNPHFIFNVLNSINRFILKNDSEAASEYLSQFARLIRMILENSKASRVSLANDMEALRIYIDMESLRFQNKFSYSIEVDPQIDQQFTEVPPLLLQPYVENAIWHGLMQKEGDGKLLIRIRQVREDCIQVEIEDDGIGREASAALKSKTAVTHKSFGLQISKDRIQIVNKIYGLNTQVAVEDLINENGEPLGTRIKLLIPV